MQTKDILQTVHPQSMASAGSPRPKAWPTKLALASPKPMPGKIQTNNKLTSTLLAASSTVPMRPTSQKKTVMPVAKNNC